MNVLSFNTKEHKVSLQYSDHADGQRTYLGLLVVLQWLKNVMNFVLAALAHCCGFHDSEKYWETKQHHRLPA